MSSMNHITAATLIAQAELKAHQLGVNVCIAVTDAGAHLAAFTRMDDAFTGSIEVAIGKARTSTLFPVPSGKFGELVRAENLTGMELTNQGLVAFPGGLPIVQDGVQIGAIGISGATAAQDEEIAEFAIKSTLEVIA